MDTILLILGLAFVAYFVWYIRNPSTQPHFAIRITTDGPKPSVGKVPDWFLSEVAEICDDENLKSGTIKAVKAKHHTYLQFSRQIPSGLQQRIRNIWNLPR